MLSSGLEPDLLLCVSAILQLHCTVARLLCNLSPISYRTIKICLQLALHRMDDTKYSDVGNIGSVRRPYIKVVARGHLIKKQNHHSSHFLFYRSPTIILTTLRVTFPPTNHPELVTATPPSEWLIIGYEPKSQFLNVFQLDQLNHVLRRRSTKRNQLVNNIYHRQRLRDRINPQNQPSSDDRIYVGWLTCSARLKQIPTIDLV